MIEYAETEGSDSTTHQTCIMQALHIKAILYADIKTIIKKNTSSLALFQPKKPLCPNEFIDTFRSLCPYI